MPGEETTFFVSYAHVREDQEFALRLAKELRADGANLWVDRLDIGYGEKWDRAVQQALNSCKGMLVILSPEAVDSDNVMDEINYAIENRKRIVPVVFRECEVPFRLRRVQYIDLTAVDEAAGMTAVRVVLGIVPGRKGPASGSLTGASRGSGPRADAEWAGQDEEARREPEAARAQEDAALGQERRTKVATADVSLLVGEAEEAGTERTRRAQERPVNWRRMAFWVMLGVVALLAVVIVLWAYEPRGMAEMVKVPAGDFLMGCNETVDQECGWAETRDERSVYVDAFSIDRTEVTVARYRECVRAGKCEDPGTRSDAPPGYQGSRCNWVEAGKDDHPINCVDWFQANTYCEWARKRLPTGAEWEKAARGTDGRIYPWGNQWSDSKGNAGGSGTMPVGSFPSGASPYGALDMAGNVWEWVSDGSKGGRGLRGGGWTDAGGWVERSSYGTSLDPSAQWAIVGFRCAH
jgi:formylglycine-generating enzyme required for sulfatase activity